MRALRFCMVTTFYPPFSFGGDGIFVHRLTEGLAERGHRVDVVHSEDAYRLQHPGDPELSFAQHANVTTHPLRSRWPMLSALSAHQLGSPAAYGGALRAVLEGGDYDVINYHNISLMGGPGVLEMGRGVKLMTPHEYWLIRPTHVLFTFDREACVERRCLSCTLHARRPPQLWRYGSHIADAVRHVDRFLMLSHFALEQHKAQGIDAPMMVLPSFVAAAGEPAPDDSVAAGTDRPFFLFVGRLEKLKGVQDLIPAFRDFDAADLIVVGDGAYRATLEAAAADVPNVKFVGALHPSEVGDYYRRALAVMVPSLCYEVFPLIPAEAFLRGTPVIARRIGALAEVVEESGGGLLFDDRDGLQHAMHQLVNEPDLRRELGRQGHDKARREWTTEAYIERYLRVVAELLADRGDA